MKPDVQDVSKQCTDTELDVCHAESTLQIIKLLDVGLQI